MPPSPLAPPGAGEPEPPHLAAYSKWARASTAARWGVLSAIFIVDLAVALVEYA